MGNTLGRWSHHDTTGFHRLYLGTRAWFGGANGRRLLISDDGGESWFNGADPSSVASSQPQVFMSTPPSTSRPGGRFFTTRCRSGKGAPGDYASPVVTASASTYEETALFYNTVHVGVQQ